jgi:probable F420-dependent oxidoreductase
MAAASWGMTVPLTGMPLSEHASVWAELADGGYTSVWSAEAAGTDGVVPLALAAAEPRLRLGTAILPVFTRAPSVLATTAATLAELAPGRVMIGLGASSPNIVSGWNGISFERPLHRTRDVLRFLRRALAGERVSGEFDTFSSTGFRLTERPEQPPELLLAALRPGMLRLAGEEADGVILNWVSEGDVGRMIEIVRERNDQARVVDRVMVRLGEDFESVRAAVAPLVAGYLTTPVYREFYAWLGHGARLTPVVEAWERGDRAGAVAAVPDELVDAVCVWGSADTCRRRLAKYRKAGVTDVVLALLPSEVGVRDAVSALAPVAPLTTSPDLQEGGVSRR